jgi:DNA-directed RNA polymerase subunit RPC12/RpoP
MMPISFTCRCGKALTVADEHAGKRTRCPRCNTALYVPSPAGAAAQVIVKCRCGGQFKAKPEHAGKRFPCPKCGSTVEVPRANTASAS